MARTGEVIPFEPRAQRDPYLSARTRLTDFLIRYALIESYRNAAQRGEEYAFVEPTGVLPSATAAARERPYQNTALIVALDGTLPRSLVKHFRVRESNRVTWRNLQRIAPHLDLGDYRAEHCQITAPGAEPLLRAVTALDYALLIERPDAAEAEPSMLTHMHVKVERLTDNAIKDLAKSLGYIERRLFERGQDYVDALEVKFFEYHGFSANASGRKSAAAMAAQLLAAQRQRFSVFVAGQEDARLTVLDETPLVTHYLLVRLSGADLRRLAAKAKRTKQEVAAAYGVARDDDGRTIATCRVRLRRTPVADPGDLTIDRSLVAPWLEIAEETLLPAPGTAAPRLAFAWSQVR